MTTANIPTPYAAKIAKFDALVAEANRRGTRGGIWDNEHLLALAKAEGYRLGYSDAVAQATPKE